MRLKARWIEFDRHWQVFYTKVCMLDAQDIKKVGDLIEEKVRPIVKAEVSSIVRTEVKDIVKAEVGAIVKAEVSSIVKDEIIPMVKFEVQAGENRVIAAVGEMLEQNVLPLIDTLGGRLDKVDGRLEDIQKTIANLPDKSYLDDKVADPEGKCIVRQKNAEKKGDLLIDFLQKKRVLEDQEVRQLKSIQIFPSPPTI